MASNAACYCNEFTNFCAIHCLSPGPIMEIPNTTFAVIDFETTGLSPSEGARATEIAVVLVRGDQVVDRYQSLMNAGAFIPYHIRELTGITPAMVAAAPRADKVMAEVQAFVGNTPLVAHNAAFDSQFWRSEFSRISVSAYQPFACTLLLSRRLFPESPGHRLGTLVSHLGLPRTGAFHRALADAEATAHLLLRIQAELRRRFGVEQASPSLLMQIQSVKRTQLESCIRRHAAPRPSAPSVAMR